MEKLISTAKDEQEEVKSVSSSSLATSTPSMLHEIWIHYSQNKRFISELETFRMKEHADVSSLLQEQHQKHCRFWDQGSPSADQRLPSSNVGETFSIGLGPATEQSMG